MQEKVTGVWNRVYLDFKVVYKNNMSEIPEKYEKLLNYTVTLSSEYKLNYQCTIPMIVGSHWYNIQHLLFQQPICSSLKAFTLLSMGIVAVEYINAASLK